MQAYVELDRRFYNLSDRATRDIDFVWASSPYGGVSWTEILDSPRVLIVSEAGTGKTEECQAQQRRLFAAGHAAFWVELASLARGELSAALGGGASLVRFETWLNDGSQQATFFLDSIDELLLTQATFEQALHAVSRGIGGRLDRARFVVTSRPTDFDRNALMSILPVPPQRDEQGQTTPAGRGFIDALVGRTAKVRRAEQTTTVPDLRVVGLLPLSVEDMLVFARARGVANPKALIEALAQRNALAFAQRPQDLIELINEWREQGELRTHRDQVSLNIEVKLRGAERRQERTLSGLKAREGARVLALALLLSRRLALRHGRASDEDHLHEVVLDPRTTLPAWTDRQRKALLERSLFGHAGYGRVRFHHRSVVEFLAAEQLMLLSDRGMSWRELAALLFVTTPQGHGVLRPTLRPTATWMAGRSKPVLEEILRREPEALLQWGDPQSLEERDRLRAVRAYIDRVKTHGREGVAFSPEQVQRIACNEVMSALPAVWASGPTNRDVRHLILQLFAARPTSEGTAIAHEVVMDANADHRERVLATEVLVAGDAATLPGLVDALVHDRDRFPDAVAKSIALELAPNHLPAPSLCQLLDRIAAGHRSGGLDLARLLARQVRTGLFNEPYAAVLQRQLAISVVAGMHWTKAEYPRYRTSRPDLAELLAAVSARNLDRLPLSAEHLGAAIVAVQVSTRDGDTVPAERLRQAAAVWPSSLRRVAFLAADTLLVGIHPDGEAWDRLDASREAGLVTLGADRDGRWVLDALGDSTIAAPTRATLLEATLHGAVPSTLTEPALHRARVAAVRDIPALEARVAQSLERPAPSDAWKRMQAQDAEHAAKRKRKAEEQEKAWQRFVNRLLRDPTRQFKPDRVAATRWWLWEGMRRAGGSDHEATWNRPFLERQFGSAITDRFKAALRTAWRDDVPTLPHERPEAERTTTLLRWAMGNTALTAESEDVGWADRLSADEAELAMRYVPLELNRFPPWLPALVRAHPGPVRAMLTQMLTDELSSIHDPQRHPTMLQYLEYADESIRGLLLPHLEDWVRCHASALPTRNRPLNPTYGIERVLRLVLKEGTEASRQLLGHIALNALARPAVGGWELLWFSTAFAIDPVSATDALEGRLAHYAVGRLGYGARLLGGLFGDRHESLRVNPRDAAYPPNVRLRLTQAAYGHVRRSDDVTHPGIYTPDARDAAEQARNAVLSALLDADGPGAWEAKMALADSGIIGDFADRARAIALAHAASAAEGPGFTTEQIQSVLAGTAPPPMTTDQMFELLVRRLNDLEDFLTTDTSARETWAQTALERPMRRLIARELEVQARGAYSIHQESVSADEKETDIRLLSSASAITGVIELKIGENWSGAELRATIHDQLVRQYLQPEHRRAGCLLVTVATERTWVNPDNAERLDVEGLRAFLSAETQRLEAVLGQQVRLAARILDLRSPLTRPPAT